MWKNMGKIKKTLVVLAGFFVFMIILGSILPKQPETANQVQNEEPKKQVEPQKVQKKTTPAKTQSSVPTAAPAPKMSQVDLAKVRLDDRVVYFGQILKNKSLAGTAHEEIIKNLKSYQTIFVSDSTQLANTDYSKKIKSYRDMLLKVMKVLYPVAREQFVESRKEAMWKIDGEVSVAGKNKSYITLINRQFARNANKSEMLEQLSNIMADYRFQKITLGWYKGDSGDTWTYKHNDANIINY